MANEATPIERAMVEATGEPLLPESELTRCLADERAKPQRFFAELAASIVNPHVGDQHRDTIRSILHRATEAGLYQEPK